MTTGLPQIEDVQGIAVVRDDLLAGGTKRRVLERVLARRPAKEFVYAASAVGHGQLALALAAADLGCRATVFVAGRKKRHPLTEAAAAAGADIRDVWQAPAYLPNVARHAVLYAGTKGEGTELLPLGFDMPEFRQELTHLARQLPVSPREVWAVLGSGALIRSLQQAWPEAKFHGVLVGRLPELQDVEVHEAPEVFERTARLPPPFPSAPHQDAKVWQFVCKRAGKGALFWNVAG